MTSRSYKPGDIVADQYEIKGVVGSGGFARVYRAVERRLGRDVALKIMASSDDSTDTESGTVYGRFVREARLVSQLNNPHTITLYDYDTLPDGRLYMALEFVEGTTLEQLLDGRQGLPPERIQRIVVQMLDGLGEAHAAGVLHRDIKPSNVMLFDRHGRTDCVKLLDFGIAKKVASEDALHEDLTVAGTLVGTPRYMSPEQIQQLPLTPASDLYSVGLLIYEMWCGQSPFPTTDVTDIFQRMQAFDRDLGALDSAPDPLKSIAARLLRPEPDDRFETAEAVLEQLGHSVDPPSGEVNGEEAAAVATVPPSFPVGFDRAADTPSTELTGVNVVEGQWTVAAERQLRKSPASPMAIGDPAVDDQAPTVEDRTPRNDRSTETNADESPATLAHTDRAAESKGVRVALVLLLLGLIGAGAYLALNVGDTEVESEDRTTERSDPAASASDDSMKQAPVGPAIERASGRVADASRRAADRAAERANAREREEPAGGTSPSNGTSDQKRDRDPSPPGRETDEPAERLPQRDSEPDESTSSDDESEGVTIEPFE